MRYIGIKNASYDVAKLMSRMLKQNQDDVNIRHVFLKYCFYFKGQLIVADNKQLVCINAENSSVQNGIFEDNCCYSFNLRKWSKELYCIELEKVENVCPLYSIERIMQFSSEADFKTIFYCVDYWMAFNYRLATFNHEMLKDAFTVAGNGGTVEVFCNRNYKGEIGSMKVENKYCKMIYMPMFNNNSPIKPHKLDEFQIS